MCMWSVLLVILCLWTSRVTKYPSFFVLVLLVIQRNIFIVVVPSVLYLHMKDNILKCDASWCLSPTYTGINFLLNILICVLISMILFTAISTIHDLQATFSISETKTLLSLCVQYSDQVLGIGDDTISYFENLAQWSRQYPDSQHFTPTAGVWWYLEAQMLPEFAGYFNKLVWCQVVFCAALVISKLSQLDATIAMNVTVVIVLLYDKFTTLMEVLMGVFLLLQHTEVVRCMRGLPWLAVGIIVPTALSPLMTVLWVEYGTVNGNFLFFQGLCMWVFCALGVVEFVTAFLSLHGEKVKLSCHVVKK